MPGADGSAQADEAIRRLAAIRRGVVSEMRRLLLRLDTQRGTSRLSADAEALVTMAQVRQQVLDLLRERGARVTVSETERLAASAAEAVARAQRARSSSRSELFGSDFRALLVRVTGPRMAEVTATFGAAEEAVAAAMRQGVTRSGDLAQLVDDVATVIDTTFARAQSAVDAAIMGAGRLATLEAGDAAAREGGSELVYRYVGPRDAKTRPFCRAHVGRAFTRAALDALDAGEGQPQPVSIYLGGFNCRHSLAPMRLQDALEDGVEVVR